MIPDESVDLIVSNCVLNLVKDGDKEKLFAEIYRVLKRGGRVAISDIVSDEDAPASLKRDPALWSGCLAGAFREDRFLEAFERAGFYGIELEKYDEQPWQTVKGIQFRSVTITAHKGKEGPCLERHAAPRPTHGCLRQNLQHPHAGALCRRDRPGAAAEAGSAEEGARLCLQHRRRPRPPPDQREALPSDRGSRT
jgi:SAM-dependent methyltransferase